MIGADVATLTENLSRDTHFVYLDRRIDDDLAAEVVALDLPGIHLQEEPARFTPSKNLAKSIIGSVADDQSGSTGIEFLYDDVLTGTPGELRYERARDGGTIAAAGESRIPAQPGSDVVLTIDRSLQYEAERVLSQQVDAMGAKGGMVVISRPATGEILASANITRNTDDEIIVAGANRAVIDVFEPGSVNKVITISAALEEGLVEPDTTTAVPDHLQVSDHMFSDDHSHPADPMTVTDILAKSSNVGTIGLAQRLGKERIDHYLRDFGFGTKTALNFTNESPGILLDADKWSGTSIGSIPIGQGIAVTAMQMLSAYNVIANDGVYVEPRLVEATVDAKAVRTPVPFDQGHRVVSETTARQVRQMLVAAVDAGTGTQAKVAGYSVGGKTGTARKPQDTGTYKDLAGNYHYVAAFTGMVPAESPAAVHHRRGRRTDRHHLRRKRRSAGLRRSGPVRPEPVPHPARRHDPRPRGEHRPRRVMLLSEAAEGLAVAGIDHDRDGDVDINGVVHHTGKVLAGALFCCVPGSRIDGHDLAEQVVAAGAAALLVERRLPVPVPQLVVPSVRAAMGPVAARFSGDPSRAMTVIGVTGTNGKTTTVTLLRSILEAAGRRCEVIGTLTSTPGGPPTTPDAPELQAQLAGWRDAGVDAVAMEVSSHALAMDRVAGTWFAATGFTMLGHDHLDLHQDMEHYFAAKATLFTPALTNRAVVRADDPWGARLVEHAQVETRPFRLTDAADIAATPGGVSFRWHGQRIELPLTGRHNVANALCAATIADWLDIDAPTIAAGLAGVGPVSGRFELVDAGQDFTVAVDYAHTPDALETVIAAARELADDAGGRVIVVFGCGGDKDRAKRPEMGRLAVESADLVVVTSDNPRSEDPEAIIAEIVAGIPEDRRRAGVEAGTLTIVPDRREAIHHAARGGRA